MSEFDPKILENPDPFMLACMLEEDRYTDEQRELIKVAIGKGLLQLSPDDFCRGVHEDSLDSVTGMSSASRVKKRFEIDLPHAIRHHENFFAATLDIEGVRYLNGTIGYQGVNDHMLKPLAWALNEAKRGSDKAARLGGDEYFVVGTANDDPSGPDVTLSAHFGVRTLKNFLEHEQYTSYRKVSSLGLLVKAGLFPVDTTWAQLIEQTDPKVGMNAKNDQGQKVYDYTQLNEGAMLTRTYMTPDSPFRHIGLLLVSKSEGLFVPYATEASMVAEIGQREFDPRAVKHIEISPDEVSAPYIF